MVLLFSVQNVFGGIGTFEWVLRHSVILMAYFAREKENIVCEVYARHRICAIFNTTCLTDPWMTGRIFQ